MALPVWPSTLPQDTLFDGYVENYPNNLLRSEGDSGFGKVRKKGATPPFRFTRNIIISRTQRATLQTFIQSTLNDGALRFEFSHPLDGGTIEMRIVPQGDYLYSVTPYGHNFRVSFDIEVLP